MLLSKVRTKTVKAALSCNMADKWISFFYFFLKKRFLNISNGFLYSCQITQLNEKFCCSFVLFNCWFLQCNLTSMVTKKVNLKHIFFVTGTCGGCTCTLYLAQFSQNFIRSFYILMIFFAYVTYFEIHCLKKKNAFPLPCFSSSCSSFRCSLQGSTTAHLLPSHSILRTIFCHTTPLHFLHHHIHPSMRS